MKTPKSKTNYKQYLRNATINFLQLHPVTDEEIGKVSNSFREKKGYAPHSIPTSILKEF